MKTLEEVTALAEKGELRGAYTDVPDAVYHSGPGYSRSNLVKCIRSLEHAEVKVEDTPALLFGRAFHTAVLEPEIFFKEYVRMPKFGRKKADLEAKEKFLQENAGKNILKEEEIELIDILRVKIGAHPTVQNIFKGGRPEVTYYWEEEVLGEKFLLKARTDWETTSGALFDLKTTGNASAPDFRRSVVNFFYDAQAALYSRGYKAVYGKEPKGFTFICVEKTEPFGIMLHTLNEASIEVGDEIINRVLYRLAEGKKEGLESRGYPLGFNSLGLPAYGFDVDSRLGF